MKIHTTNYTDTFIKIADDCPATAGERPPSGNKKSIAELEYEMLHGHPYKYTSDEVLFRVYAQRNDLTETEQAEAKALFFSKGQPCFRASPLTKRYGWGVHYDHKGRMALYGCETADYGKFSGDDQLKILKAMKAKR